MGLKKWCLAALVALPLFALDTTKLKPTGYVNDFAHVLDAASAARLEAYCANLEKTTGAQMAVVTVDSLEDDPIEDVSNKLFREWGIGKKGKDEGILLLLSVKDRKNRAEIGYGLEPIINDGYAGGVLRGIRPILRQGNYGAALLAAVQEMGARIAQQKGVDLGDGVPATALPGVAPTRIPFPLIIIGFFVILWVFSRLSGGGGGSGLGGFLTGMLLGNMMGRRGGWGGGGFGGSDGGGGGGFGGFGGGDSGGGGASSDW